MCAFIMAHIRKCVLWNKNHTCENQYKENFQLPTAGIYHRTQALYQSESLCILLSNKKSNVLLYSEIIFCLLIYYLQQKATNYGLSSNNLAYMISSLMSYRINRYNSYFCYLLLSFLIHLFTINCLNVITKKYKRYIFSPDIIFHLYFKT